MAAIQYSKTPYDDEALQGLQDYDNDLESIGLRESIDKHMTEDAFYVIPGESKISGTWSGRDAIEAFYELWMGAGDVGFEPGVTLAGDSNVVILGRFWGIKEHSRFETEFLAHYVMSDGKVASMRFLPFDLPLFSSFFD